MSHFINCSLFLSLLLITPPSTLSDPVLITFSSTGLINAFVSLCSCAKKLIPALVYAIIIVWIYGVVIFTLFIKSQQHQLSVGLSHDHFAETNASVSDSSGNENITKESYASVFVDQSYLTPSTSKQFQNFSFGLSVECLPTNLRYVHTVNFVTSSCFPL